MLEKLYEEKNDVTGLTTGFRDLNKKINGLQRSDLLLIAARPAMGKTAFALNFCLLYTSYHKKIKIKS